MVVSLVQHFRRPHEVTGRATGGGQFDTELQMAMWFDDRFVLGVTRCMHLYIDRYIPEGKRTTSVTIFYCHVTPSSAQCMSIVDSGFGRAWSLPWVKVVMHVAVQHITTFNVALVFLLVSVCCDTAQAKTGTGGSEKWWSVDTVFQTPT